MTPRKAKPELKPGDRIKFEGGVSDNATGSFCMNSPWLAEVIPNELRQPDNRLKIRFLAADGTTKVDGFIHRRQVVSRLKPRPAKRPESPRVERWVNVYSGRLNDSIWPTKEEADRVRGGNSEKQLHLVELREGESICPPGSIPLSWADLARAFAQAFGGNEFGEVQQRTAFITMAETLNLPKEETK